MNEDNVSPEKGKLLEEFGRVLDAQPVSAEGRMLYDPETDSIIYGSRNAPFKPGVPALLAGLIRRGVK